VGFTSGPSHLAVIAFQLVDQQSWYTLASTFFVGILWIYHFGFVEKLHKRIISGRDRSMEIRMRLLKSNIIRLILALVLFACSIVYLYARLVSLWVNAIGA
jgi:hypothetical protein